MSSLFLVFVLLDGPVRAPEDQYLDHVLELLVIREPDHQLLVRLQHPVLEVALHQAVYDVLLHLRVIAFAQYLYQNTLEVVDTHGCGIVIVYCFF